MAITFFTDASRSLLNEFDARIKQSEQKGKITTWEKSDDGIYYTHKASEWTKKAWLKPTVFKDGLVFNIIKPKNIDVTAVVYAYYHGHLIETFLNHFDKKFSTGAASALPTSDDLCSS